MGVRIIIDSSSDFEPDLAKEQDLIVIPMKCTFGTHEYAEGVDLSREEFYDLLSTSDDFPHTSQITPFEFAEALDAVSPDDEAVIITLSGKISGTVENARAAAAAHDRTAYVVDSENATIGERVLIERAIELRDAGKSAEEIAQTLDVEKKDVRLVALLDTLEYLKKGGRISAVTAAAGGLLSIKPVVGVKDGEVVVLGKARGSKQGNNLLRRKVAETGVDFSRPVHLGYTGKSTKLLRKYVEDSRDLFEEHFDELRASIVGSTIGTHVGPDAIAVAYFAPAHEA